MKLNVYVGVIGSGKDYTAKRDCGIQLGFADALRDELWTLLGWKPKTVEEYEVFKETTFYPPDLTSVIGFGTENPLQFTGRELLQRLGSARTLEDPDYWLKKLVKTLESLDTDEVVGITDCRFHNEARGLMDFCYHKDIELVFIHCDYHSERYDSSNTHKSEAMAQEILKASKKADWKGINNYIIEKNIIWYVYKKN